jgi:hypothetical protein
MKNIRKIDTGWASLIRNAWDRKCLAFPIFSRFEILAYYEIAWGWEPNLNAKYIHISYAAYVYIGFKNKLGIEVNHKYLHLYSTVFMSESKEFRILEVFGFRKFE